jgi:hypothetical protein
MSTDVGIWLYDLAKCGYFPWKGGPALFGSAARTFESLQRWSHGKPLGQTTTFKVNQEGDLNDVFLLGMTQAANGDFLVALWNRAPGNGNHVASVGVGDLVGAASAEITKVDKNRIPGYATYFWVMPSALRIATIRLKNFSNGLVAFRHYVTNFLTYINPAHVVLDEPDPDNTIRIKGYRRDSNSEVEDRGIRATFNVKSIALGGDLGTLRAQAENIEKVSVKTSLSTVEQQGYQAWQLFQKVGRIFGQRAPIVEEVPIRLEIPMTFDLESLNETIAAWEDDLNDSESRQNDIGFRLRGTNNYKWLSKTQPRKTVALQVQWVDNELVNIDALLEQLQTQRAEILALG